MSLFFDPKYDYWDSHFLYIWSIRNTDLEGNLLSILDQRAGALFLICKHLDANPNLQISPNQFSALPASFEDLQAFTFIASSYLGAKFDMINHNILYTP